jgi:predicted CXXCH cytochrome family protein
LLFSVSACLGQERVTDTVHNLSVSGPGRFRASSESQVCVFCHATHKATGMRPLWNRQVSPSSYKIYESSTLDANPGQPTGVSKLCLSCHDGTIALGSVLSHTERIRITGGDYIPSGLTNLGTDLSDDHPISFFFTGGVASSDRQLIDPVAWPDEIHLDQTGQLQCTSCHDPHQNRYGDFLVTRPERGALCTSCHRMDGWTTSSHAASSATVLGTRTGDWPFATVADNACRSCHRPHTAGGRERLMIAEKEEDNCLCCHDGTVARTNIEAELDKITGHDPRRSFGDHDPAESRPGDNPHAECSDCHNPHAVSAEVLTTQYTPIGATQAHVKGVDVGGATVDNAQYEYQVCLRCHGDAAVTVRGRILRQVQDSNLRLKFSSGNASFHPVVVSSPGQSTVSLIASMPSGTLIRCTDCHNNDTGPRAGGSGPDGPHGSNFEFLLERNYTTRDDTVESEFEYALCYKCHRRTSILSDQSFPHHRLHVVDARAPCSSCHDPHGISLTQALGSDHTHLINFDTRIVQPTGGTRTLRFRDLGDTAGSCTLTCHGVEHKTQVYGLGLP